jgi:hypothetical protein
MNKRICVLIVLFLITLAGCHSTNKTKHPNVIFILTDQWRADALGPLALQQQ